MPRRAAVQLPEMLDLFQRHGQFAGRLAVGVELLHARQMEHGVEQHRGVPAREHEPIAVGPGWVGRVVVQQLIPKRVSDGRQRHGRAGMPAVGGLDRIHGQSSNRIDRQLVDRDFCSGHISTFDRRKVFGREGGETSTGKCEPEIVRFALSLGAVRPVVNVLGGKPA